MTTWTPLRRLPLSHWKGACSGLTECHAFIKPAHHSISVKLSMITISSSLRLRDIEDLLWKAALKSAAKAKIFPACERSLRAWIIVAVQRMGRQHRLGPKDVSIAEESVSKFVELLKREAVLLGRPSNLGSATFQAARRRLREQGALIPVTLWPFWPHHFDVKN